MELSAISEKIIHVRQGRLEYPCLVLRLVGASPLLMSNPEAIGLPATKDPAEDAAPRAYRLADRTLGFPAGAVRASICNGGGLLSQKINRRSPATVLFQATLVDEVLVPFQRDGIAFSDYELSKERVVIKVGSQKNSVMRGRPMIELPWTLTVPILWDIDANHPSEHAAFAKVLIEAAETAGRRIGIGDWRPQCKGSRGRFTVEVV